MAAIKVVSMAIAGSLVLLPVVSPAHALPIVNKSADFNSVLINAQEPDVTDIKIGDKEVIIEGKNLDRVNKITIYDLNGNKLLEVEKNDFKKQGANEIILEDKDSKVKPGEKVKIEYEFPKENGEILKDSENLNTTKSDARFEYLEKTNSDVRIVP